MRIDDRVYFAPGLPFDEVDFSGDELPRQLEARIRGFYIEPARLCPDNEHGFSAGVLLVSCIDALARMQTGSTKVKRRFTHFARNQLKSFAVDDRAEKLYDFFRNGLLHECRIKSGAQFSLQTAETVYEAGALLVVNPLFLADEVDESLRSYVALLTNDKARRTGLAQLLFKDHQTDR